MVHSAPTPRRDLRAFWWALASIVVTLLILGTIVLTVANPFSRGSPAAAVATTTFPPPSPSPTPSPSPSPRPSPTPAYPAPPAGLGPSAISIPQVGLASAPIIEMGMTNGALDVPTNVRQVAHYSGSPGLHAKAGTVIIAGHVNSRAQGQGALGLLWNAKVGQYVYATDAAGKVTVWKMTEIEQMAKAELTADIIKQDGPLRMIMITCGGPLLNTGHYRDNIVVHAVRVAG